MKPIILLLVLAATLCAQERHIQWKSGDPCCERIYSEGDPIRIIRDNGITVAVVGYDSGDNLIAEVSVVNETQTRVDVLPEKFLVVYWKDRSKPPEEYRPLSPEKVAGRYKSRAGWGNFFRSLAAGIAQSQTTETGTVSVMGPEGMATGVYSSTTTTTNNAALANAARANQRATNEAQGKANYVINSALKANTLFPSTYTSGMVYFPRKKFVLGLIAVRIGDTSYEFWVGPK